ncbi:hypothetical protein [Microbacterium thalli]|uniref:Uncharacterized protein n=1 Tax=Microbacterium thalli TaxID=3027921 RepID=A0ABT5SGZ0_9MICO|nr:hypothetical protein [Microbacterium thalli]MDD7930582.1 hypothetical protein [Microbacterium thalli]MDD7962048.1 hypothetical protein [Microbacterium thalli]MDN8549746.1 hypothetical protein [Microbacterium thalli]
MSTTEADVVGLRSAILGEVESGRRFRMMLPPGWETHDLSEKARDALLERAGARFARHHRPDLFASLSAQVERAVEEMRSQQAVALAFAGDESPTWSLGTASLLGTVRVGTPEMPLDSIVRRAIDRGGVAIDEDFRIVRWTERRAVSMDGVDLDTTMVNYLIPVPGTQRGKAVQWTLTIPHEQDLPVDDPRLEMWVELMDAHVATFQWDAKQ